MFFLIEYNRSIGKLVSLRTFSTLRSAEDKRLELEFSLHSSGIEHEVVVLEADSEAAIRKTHRRYFEDLKDLLQPVAL